MKSTNKTLQTINYIWPPAIIATIIFYLSCLIAPSDVPEVEFDFPIEVDKIVHFLMYFGLASVASFNYIFIHKGKIIILRMLAFAVLVPIIYGGLIEVLQDNYFDRTGDWFDFLANSLGALSTIPFSLAFRKIMLKREARNLAAAEGIEDF